MLKLSKKYSEANDYKENEGVLIPNRGTYFTVALLKFPSIS